MVTTTRPLPISARQSDLTRDANAYYSRANAYNKTGEYDKSIADCTESVRLKPAFSEAYKIRGIAYSMNGQKSKAEEDFAQAKRLGYKEK